jgi:hypothetical protein
LYFAIAEIKCHDGARARCKASSQLERFASYLHKTFKQGDTQIEITPYYVYGVDESHYAVERTEGGLWELVEAEYQFGGGLE